jgi:hypothetical protein
MTRTKALILLTSQPETVEIAVRELRPNILGVIFSQDVLLAAAAKRSELDRQKTEFRYRIVDDPMKYVDGLVSGSEARSPAAHATFKGL